MGKRVDFSARTVITGELSPLMAEEEFDYSDNTSCFSGCCE